VTKPMQSGVSPQPSANRTSDAPRVCEGRKRPCRCSGTRAEIKSVVRRGLLFQIAVLAVVISALAGMGLARWLRTPEPEPRNSTGPFQGWDSPDLVLVLSGQQHGYLLPCGCSRPQVGGLERRYNLIESLRQRGWPVACADLGDIPQKRGPVHLPNLQGMIKYRYSMHALDKMGYLGVGLGEYEASLTLFRTLGEYALNYDSPRVLAANLDKRETMFPGQVHALAVTRPRGSSLTVGLTCVLGRTVAEKIKEPGVVFGSRVRALDQVVKTMKEKKVDLPILLYQGRVTSNRGKGEYTEAMACAKHYPQFPILLALCDEEEPPGQPLEIPQANGQKSWIITVGQKGKYVGVVGVWKTSDANKPLAFRYQLVEMTEDYLTPREKEDQHPVVNLLEEYTRELKRDHYLEKTGRGQHMLQAMAPIPGLKGDNFPTYLGSDACKRCHEEAYEVWAKSGHSHAYQTLVDARRPSLRQYDPECIVCHTTGFGYQGGFISAEKTPQLKNVGCESCHGPGSVHAKNPRNLEWRLRMNPWHQPKKEKPEQKDKRLARIDHFCQNCHDIDNDVHWTHQGLKKKWPPIAHPFFWREEASR
jgi:hypothetical protein